MPSSLLPFAAARMVVPLRLAHQVAAGELEKVVVVAASHEMSLPLLEAATSHQQQAVASPLEQREAVSGMMATGTEHRALPPPASSRLQRFADDKRVGRPTNLEKLLCRHHRLRAMGSTGQACSSELKVENDEKLSCIFLTLTGPGQQRIGVLC